MRWTAVLLLLALLVPVLLVAADALRGRRRQPELPPPEAAPDQTDILEQRVRGLEDDVSDLARDVGELRDELYTLQRQLEAGTPPSAPRRGEDR